ncbi:DNA repair ATPase [Aliikangiella maris]|uniref:DNA repair ATPase n=2 Tax=Aliikangiella maris TaxID=3162458 RepID=A0ABV2BW10_9GAMM
MAQENQNSSIIEQAVAEGGAYEVIRQRLIEQGKSYQQLIEKLNQSRQAEFGSTDMSVMSRLRLRTENNCQAKDLVIVGNHILFGYNVFLGLKKETKVEDVFSLYELNENNGEFELKNIPLDQSFLADQRFQSEFNELYSYYKDTVLSQLVFKENKLLASFQIGKKLSDIRVFRWEVSADGNRIEYIDNRGERDIQLPASHSFEWTACTREDVVEGRNPHINILDTLFVDSLRGDITVKIENNTNVGLGIYSEPVEEKNQALDDAEFYYADLNPIILLKIKPYMEDIYRYLVFNRQTKSIYRIDAIGDACVQLPESHGIIFPGGYCLSTGEYKTFEDNIEGLVFKRSIRSPNGEDVLFIFYQPESNIIALYPYNLINKSLQNPLFGHGFGFYEDGKMLIFYAEQEPSRIHPIQIWQTPYFSEVFASNQPVSQSFYGKIGNAELVRGISELYAIAKSVMEEDVSADHYHRLSEQCDKIFDAYFWLDSPELKAIAQLTKEIGHTAENVIDEYEKVVSIKQQSEKALVEAQASQKEIIRHIEPQSWHSPQDYVESLSNIRHHRGHLLTIRDYRYIDIESVDSLDKEIQKVEQEVSQHTVKFLASKDALVSYYKALEKNKNESQKAKTNAELAPFIEAIENIANGLDLISEILATLKIEDATVQTQIVDEVSTLYAKLNQQKAQLSHQRKSMGSAEATAQFAARIKLLNQSIHNALGLASTPERCDEQLSRLLVQLEELEGEFSEYDDFISDIIVKREEIFESFEEHKQSLLEARQRKVQSLAQAGERILQSIERRIKRFNDQDELNTFFASDGLVSKVKQIIGQIQELDDSVKAEDLNAKIKAINQQAIRSLRDKQDLFESGGQVIKLGPTHKFSVNTQELDLTILPQGEQLAVRLTGTDYFEILNDERLQKLQEYWSLSLPSETENLYRSEYLAYSILKTAEKNQDDLKWSELLLAIHDEKQLSDIVSTYATPRFREGYEKGIHDHDAMLILKTLIPVYDLAGVLKYAPKVRGMAIIFWANQQNQAALKLWPEQAMNAIQMVQVFTNYHAVDLLVDEVNQHMSKFFSQHGLVVSSSECINICRYLIDELAQETVAFATSKYALRLVDEFKSHLQSQDVWHSYQQSLKHLTGQVGRRWQLSESWLSAFIKANKKEQYKNYIGEAVAILNAEQRVSRTENEIDIQMKIEGLLGTHPKINNQQLFIQLDQFLTLNQLHLEQVIPGFNQYLQVRQTVIEEQKQALRLSEFKPKPLSSFVRNRLINDVYLPIIGDNLAKQMGTVGDNKRSDLMGLLLMISPPGYGKTTLMEYVAERLGLIFMKINCPVIGHHVTSIDPQQADNSACRQELEKLNLALEMGNNVMLYLDDIQHTNSEFLQKFISLCDGTRRIEGVWKNQAKTYDMRGKKFCVVMAGNPYTESGESFQIPDMLANRADIYNLGDVLSGKEAVFTLSYIENALTSNRILAPLATRDMSDVYRFIDMSQGKNIPTTELVHQYSGAEVKEIVAVLERLQKIQQTVWRVNQAYIAASAQDDKYRTEPVFKLQGSYRNMNKMAEKVSAIMIDEEVERLINDHYQGEAQLLTKGTESNLLKLAELRGCLNDGQKQRWQQIKDDFMRNRAMGGDDADVGNKIVAQLADLVNGLKRFESTLTVPHTVSNDEELSQTTNTLQKELNTILKDIALQVSKMATANQFSENAQSKLDKTMQTSLADRDNIKLVLESTLMPLIRIMDGKLDLDLKTHRKMNEINERLAFITDRRSPKKHADNLSEESFQEKSDEPTNNN